jgi:predicted nucleotidyltransferase
LAEIHGDRWFREGDFIETSEGLIFSVRGIVHPPSRAVAFPKYVPSLMGDRRREAVNYVKIDSLRGCYDFLENKAPDYLIFDPVFGETLSEVPFSRIKTYFSANDGLTKLRRKGKLDRVQKDAVDFANLIKQYAGVSWSALGISGSILVGLQRSKSDIDLIVYGEKNCRKVYQTIKKLVREEPKQVKRYTLKGLKRLYRSRVVDTKISFEEFLDAERNKFLQGEFRDRDYFIRLVKNPWEVNEVYGDVRYISMGFVEVEAHVVDDSESIFTPCKYLVNDTKMLIGPKIGAIREIVAFRGRFCEGAKKGQTVRVSGKLEKVSGLVEEYFRVIVGNRLEDYFLKVK